MRNKQTYEPFSPELIGRQTEVFLGKKSGKHSVSYLLQSDGIEVTDDQLREIVNELKKRQEMQSKEIVRARFMDVKQKMRTLHTGIYKSEFLDIVRKVTEKAT